MAPRLRLKEEVALAEYIVGPAHELPDGSKRIIDAGGVEVAVFNVHGFYYALPNHCIHQGGPVCEGRITGTVRSSAATGWRLQWVQEGEIISCPWHGLEFDIMTGRCLARRRIRLRQYLTRVEDGQVKVVV